MTPARSTVSTLAILLAVAPTLGAQAPPDTDVFLATVEGDGASWTVGEVENLTARPGYDNQPAFAPDGRSLLYTVVGEEGRADIWRYDLDGGRIAPVTRTPESEYSPTPIPGSHRFSAVRVERDSTQRLWSFDPSSGDPRLLLPDVRPVGYHAWADSSTLVLFVLGDPPTLRVATPGPGAAEVVARNVGRSLQAIPGTAAVSFVALGEADRGWITRFDPAAGEMERIAPALDGGVDHAWTPDGRLLMGRGATLYRWSGEEAGEDAVEAGAEGRWIPVGDLSSHGLRSITRLAVSPDGRRIAVVAETGAPPLTEHPRVRQAAELLDTWAEAELAYRQVPGASLAAVQDQELLFAGSWGLARPEEDVPSTPQTLYSICSISKLFTSVAAMDLWEEGRLELNDPVGEHLDWFELEERDRGLPITLERLLTHSSGLPRESDYPYWTAPSFDFPSRSEIRRRLPDQETLYPAATYFQYSNLGLTLAGEIVAEVSGRPYDEFVRDRVLEPLELADTRPSIPWDSAGDRMASGYSALTREGVREPVAPFDAEGITPAAGYSSTVLDLVRFASWQLRLLEADSAEVLRPATLREMHRVHWVDPDWDVHWGLGFVVWRDGDRTFVGHGGSCPGFRSHLAIQPGEDLAAAFAANASGVNAGRFTENAHRILGPAVAEARDTASPAPSPDTAFQRYVGTYSTHPWGGETAVLFWKDGLAMVDLPTDGPMEALQELEHVEDHTFRRVRDDGTLGETVRFEVNASGAVRAMIHHSNRWPRMERGG